MDLVLKAASKRFGPQWVFRNLSFVFKSPGYYAISGPNGSGKSTLIELMLGRIQLNQGEYLILDGNNRVDINKFIEKLSFSAPYCHFSDDLTVEETVEHHAKFKPFLQGINVDELITLCYLQDARQKKMGALSSGMQQRLKLALAICSQSEIVILDEPGTNLDKKALAWFQSAMNQWGEGRMIIIASNSEEDFMPHSVRLDMGHYI